MTIEDIIQYKLEKILGKEKYTLVTDNDIKYILAQAKIKIQTYCHRLDIPQEAYYVWADMAIDILKNSDPSIFNKDETDEQIDKRINSIKTGDTTISLNSSSTVEAKGGNNGSGGQDELLLSYWNQLQSFRKFPKGCGCGLDGV